MPGGFEIFDGGGRPRKRRNGGKRGEEWDMACLAGRVSHCFIVLALTKPESLPPTQQVESDDSDGSLPP